MLAALLSVWSSWLAAAPAVLSVPPQVWENKALDQICFTTEIVTSGTLKQYTNRVKSIKLKVIKKSVRGRLHTSCRSDAGAGSLVTRYALLML
jgi:hypothetical protein